MFLMGVSVRDRVRLRRLLSFENKAKASPLALHVYLPRLYSILDRTPLKSKAFMLVLSDLFVLKKLCKHYINLGVLPDDFLFYIQLRDYLEYSREDWQKQISMENRR